MIHPRAFREYDIRGLAGEDLDEAAYHVLGQGVGSHLRRKYPGTIPVVCTGRDARSTSGRYHAALLQGLAASGCRAIDLGMVPTPTVYFAQHALEAHGAAVVTASHNPREYNGLKLRSLGGPLFGDELRAVRDLIGSGNLFTGDGEVTEKDIQPDYVNTVASWTPVSRPVRLVLDTGNGAAGPLATRLFETLGCDVHACFTEPDGTFPHHLPDPTVPRHMRTLARLVQETGAPVGIGLDGDGDRIGVVDETGRLWPGDRLLRLFAREILQTRPGSPIVFDVKCSQELIEEIERRGGRPVMCRTGYPFIIEKMKETGAPLGGEMSGHVYFADRYHGFDDGLYAGARLLAILAENDTPLSQLAPQGRFVGTPELRLPCDEEAKQPAVAGLAEHYRTRTPVVEIDGARVQFEHGWVLLRASNTEPVLVLRAEAVSSEALETMLKEVEQVLARTGGLRFDLCAEYHRAL